MPDVAIIDLGIANRASVANVFDRLGVHYQFTRAPADVRAARSVVLPGVGAFGAGMRRLHEHGLVTAVREAVDRGTPTLGICLGFQLLCESSAESPGVEGIGVIPGRCVRLPAEVRVPHLGWNAVQAPDGASLLASGMAAYANSYALREAPMGWTVSRTTHAVPFVAAAERGSVLACQFHPELSGAWGMSLVDRWLGGTTVSSTARSAIGTSGLCRRLIPCLDVRDGRVVKGIRFQGLRDAGNPANRAARQASANFWSR